MKNKFNFKLILAFFWCLVTVALVGWWWIWALSISEQLPQFHRMIRYEGTALFTIVVLGCGFLLSTIWHDHKKNERLKLFFSVFTHDIKTSISRLNLQSAVLAEEFENNKTLSRFKNDLSRLDLQLENSLLLTNQDYNKPLIEKIKLSQIISVIKDDFPTLLIEINKDIFVFVDRKWMLCIFRNIFQNAITHGHATEIKISTFIESVQNKPSLAKIHLNDNGSGLNLNHFSKLPQLGHEILKSNLTQSNGIGLYLSKTLLHKMNSSILFQSTQAGFQVTLSVPGELL